MGITDLEIYTYEEFCILLKRENCDIDDFIKRCEKLTFKPNFVVTWDKPREELSKEINEWYNEEQFIGYVNKIWLCQIEFEREEDVVAFKLRWL